MAAGQVGEVGRYQSRWVGGQWLGGGGVGDASVVMLISGILSSG